jgi:formate dehydrogenase beta subunit
MLALPREVEEGLEEGVYIQFLAVPTAILADNGRLVGIECVRMMLGEVEPTGRRHAVPVPDSSFTMPLDNVIVAVGQQPDLSFLQGVEGLQISRTGTLVVDPETLATGRMGVFAGGDVVMGPSTIAGSIAQGKLAAESIRKYLRDETLAREYSVEPPSQYVPPLELTEEELTELEQLRRCPIPRLPVDQRVASFNTVEQCLSETVATKEAKRCLRCHLDR